MTTLARLAWPPLPAAPAHGPRGVRARRVWDAVMENARMRMDPRGDPRDAPRECAREAARIRQPERRHLNN